MRLFLDTNAYSALVRGHRDVSTRVREAKRVNLSVVVVGELLAGFRGGSKESWNRRVLDDFLRHPQVGTLPLTWSTAEGFGTIWSALRDRGRPIPTNDIWIAAHAMEHAAELLTLDRHFLEIEGLRSICPDSR